MRRRGWTVLVGVGSVLAISAAIGVSALQTPAASPSSSSASTMSDSVLTRRGDLQQEQSVTGTLGYGAATARTSRGSGTITSLPAVASTVRRGEPLWRVNNAPVVLLYGSIPLYRTLDVKDGTQAGPDVDLVAANLHQLGFWHGSTRRATYSRYLAAAVTSWQRSLHEPATGVLRPGDAVVAVSAVRIAEVTGHVGDQAVGPMLSTTSTRRSITLKLTAPLAQSLKPAQPVTVTLPDGTTVDAAVSTIGSTAEGADGAPATVSIALRTQNTTAVAASALGPVTAGIVTASRHDVVQVPVGALLALAGGGYALQRPDLSLLRVQVGMVAAGMAEVSGVAAGVRVLVAS